MKYLIVNADDYGYTPSVSKGIIKAHTEGIVTSTSVMIDCVSPSDISLLKTLPTISKGLHFVFSKRFYQKDKNIIQKELHRQVSKFREKFGQKPDHLDYHKFLPQ